MKFIPSQKNQYHTWERRIVTYTVIFVACGIFVGINSKIVHASITSFVSSIFGSESASAKISLPGSNNTQTLALLKAAVNSDPNPEKTGDIIPVQAGATLVPDLAMVNTDSLNTVTNTQISIYTVQKGDTLSGIGEMFGVSVNTILWANDITKARGIQPGQTLVILPVSGVTYTVKKGDTITGIVSKYKADLEEVLLHNDLTLSSPLTVGQNIILPDVEINTSLPTSVAKSASNKTPNYAGYYIRPVRNATKTQGIHGYNGVDLAGPVGTPIYASAEGTVIVARNDGGYNGGYGNFVIITHPNNTQTVYAHLSKTLVKAGDYVDQGDNIGLMGSTGKSTGSHLHFEIRGAKNPF